MKTSLVPTVFFIELIMIKNTPYATRLYHGLFVRYSELRDEPTVGVSVTREQQRDARRCFRVLCTARIYHPELHQVRE